MCREGICVGLTNERELRFWGTGGRQAEGCGSGPREAGRERSGWLQLAEKSAQTSARRHGPALAIRWKIRSWRDSDDRGGATVEVGAEEVYWNRPSRVSARCLPF